MGLLLLSCGPAEIVDPVSDDVETDEWEPLLTVEEAAEAFGVGVGDTYGGRSVFWKDLVIYSGYGDFNLQKPILLFYDMNTGETSPVCQDAVCTHNSKSCPLYEAGNYTVEKDTLYFVKESPRSADNELMVICSYGLTTGEYKELADFSERFVGTAFWIYDGALYFVESELPEGAEGPESWMEYNAYLRRCDLSTEKTETVLTIAEKAIKQGAANNAFFCFVDPEGRLFWIEPGGEDKRTTTKVYCCSVTGRTPLTLLAELDDPSSIENYGYHWGYYNGEFIINLLTETDQKKRIDFYTIYGINAETGKVRELVSETWDDFQVVGKYLYYFTAPENAENWQKEVRQRNLVTGEEKVFSFDGFQYAPGDSFLYRGRLYDFSSIFYDTEKQEYMNFISNISLAEIDLASGKIRTVE